MFDFYKQKPSWLPRTLYRQIAKIASDKPERDLANFIGSYIESTKGPDYLKMTWILPAHLRKSLNSKQIAAVEQFLASQRKRRPEKLRHAVFPHVADEFDLSNEFLTEVFDKQAVCPLGPKDIVYTIGSCFARNFARYLGEKGISCKNFGQAEDLNSPGSNQILLECARNLDSKVYMGRIHTEFLKMWSGVDENIVDKMYEQHIQSLYDLRDSLVQSTKVIVTLGNTVDYYQIDSSGNERLVPKFLAMSPSEDVRVRESISSRLSKLQTFIRLSRFLEVRTYITAIYHHIRAINPRCSIIFTVSPVPIDSVLGLQGTKLRAVEVDCVSKSTIRAALHEAMHADAQMSVDADLYYLPSFEIVRWIAPLVGLPVFGMEDAASRHVSNAVLNAVCDYAYKADQQWSLMRPSGIVKAVKPQAGGAFHLSQLNHRTCQRSPPRRHAFISQLQRANSGRENSASRVYGAQSDADHSITRQAGEKSAPEFYPAPPLTRGWGFLLGEA